MIFGYEVQLFELFEYLTERLDSGNTLLLTKGELAKIYRTLSTS